MPYKDRKTKLLHAKIIYDERKSKGLCVACGEKNDRIDDGYVYCSWCAKKRIMDRKRYRNGGCGHHDCTTCPYPYCNADEKKIEKRDRKALENTRRTFPEYNRRNLELGLCPRCGRPKEDETKRNCRRCQDMMNANSRKYARKKYVRPVNIDSGNLCHVCHKFPVVDGYNTCEKCLERCRNNAKKLREHPNTKRTMDEQKRWIHVNIYQNHSK